MTLAVRPANGGDAALISLLGRVTFAETFGYLFDQHPQDLRHYLDSTFGAAKIAASLEQPANAYWLALREGTPVGYAKQKHGSAPPGSTTAAAVQLQKIYLLHEFLGQGLGRDLLRAVLDAAAPLASLVWLDVLHENTRAIRFYEREGFKPIGEDHYTIGQQTFLFRLMARELS